MWVTAGDAITMTGVVRSLAAIQALLPAPTLGPEDPFKRDRDVARD
jgi:hypothetical protein